jgi:hypothetical protein
VIGVRTATIGVRPRRRIAGVAAVAAQAALPAALPVETRVGAAAARVVASGRAGR